MGKNNNSSQITNRGKMLVGYLIPIVGVAFLLCDKTKDQETQSHFKRATTLFLCYIVYTIAAQFVPVLDAASGLVYIAYIGTLVFCGIKAYQGQEVNIPGIDEISNSLFK